MKTIKDIRDEFVLKLSNEEYVVDKTGVKTIEIVGAQFKADQDVIFGTLNTEYAERELAWYKSQSLSVNDIPEPVPEIWKKVASTTGMINSNYGWCIWSKDNYSQFENVLRELITNPDSRRAQMIYTRPSIWVDYNKEGMSDFICTTAVQYFIRENRLVTYVTMRSGDAVFGYKNDVFWQKYVADIISRRLGIICGDVIWNVASLHVYERHFYLVKDYGTRI
ncbi:MAG: hypothetical protein [Caudovirales sp. ctOwN3]|nr:MAG: hypothetical protein [Caudovirales sp. ctOwN3]